MGPQELKSTQEGLPAAAAAELAAAGWLKNGIAGEREEGTWAVPGLTITSFHLDQLRASLKVGQNT